MNVQQEASEALLDRGVSVPLKEIRLFGRRITLRLVLKRPCLGNRIRIAREYLMLDCTSEQMSRFTDVDQMTFVAVHGKRLSRMMALCVCRGYVSGGLFTPLVAFLIRWFIPPALIQGVILNFISLMGTKDFMNFIRSVERMNPMQPRLSQK
ncbi:hypothetical protein EZS27_004686 [termite gut metagenome]|uniref:Uncharacterized protein n=1 Tax=termite gut metagenome TaxID=433724 RepID=A0A5J4SQZ5_9ZZZZ